MSDWSPAYRDAWNAGYRAAHRDRDELAAIGDLEAAARTDRLLGIEAAAQRLVDHDTSGRRHVELLR